MTRRIYAFTGTRQGLTPEQHDRLQDVIDVLQPVLVHNGACEGADRAMHRLCRGRAILSEYHPSNSEQMAWAKSIRHAQEAIRALRGPLLRNGVMVRLGVRGLIATPGEEHEILRSGTWATIRVARKHNRPIWIISPSGLVRAE